MTTSCILRCWTRASIRTSRRSMTALHLEAANLHAHVLGIDDLLGARTDLSVEEVREELGARVTVLCAAERESFFGVVFLWGLDVDDSLESDASRLEIHERVTAGGML